MIEELTASPDQDKKPEEPETPQHRPEDSHYVEEGLDGPTEPKEIKKKE